LAVALSLGLPYPWPTRRKRPYECDVLLDRIENHRETALIALDESELSAGLGISAIAGDPRAVGREAARLAVARIESPDVARRTVLLPSTLVERGSGEVPASRMRH
jgi:LacI family transcriptional regulator